MACIPGLRGGEDAFEHFLTSTKWLREHIGLEKADEIHKVKYSSHSTRAKRRVTFDLDLSHTEPTGKPRRTGCIQRVSPQPIGKSGGTLSREDTT